MKKLVNGKLIEMSPEELEKFEDGRRPTAENVIAERDRRLSLGFDFDFGDERGVHRIGTTKDDLEGWDEVHKKADLIRRNVIDETHIGISTDTGAALITPVEWDLMQAAAANFRQPIWQASFGLQAMKPIPSDYADDGFWP